VGAITVHFQPMMRDAGLSADQAARYASLNGPASLAGHLIVGRLLDRCPTHIVAALCFASPAAVCLILLNYDGSAALSFAAAIILGFAQGIEGDLFAYVCARYFGLKHYGAAYGIVVGLFAFGFGLASVVAGAAFDLLGSYASILWALLGGLGVSIFLAVLLGRPPTFAADGRGP
jgi:predicted MFS family arabinose efflux permease